MLFNSYVFIFAFFPITVIVYFLLNRFRWTVSAKVWLAGASLFFYSWWDVTYLPLILASIAFNYAVGQALGRMSQRTGPKVHKRRKAVLMAGIAANLLLLGYYKYADFFIENLNSLFSADMGLLRLVLPLGISFFTFTQIAYLVDAYRGEAQEYNPVNYVLFVTFYPHLIAGPILHHKEMMPQFDRLRNKLFTSRNVSVGLFIFCLGLFKKAVIADSFAPIAAYGFDQADVLLFVEAWVTSLAYTLQLYFDFSGYSDMAIGIALVFNIRLPINFNSPYQSVSIQDFWRRWHMTLSRFLRDYVYIPMGGNRKGEFRTCLNLMLTFLLGGLWHGAGWTFLFWGFLHGAALVVHRLWHRTGIRMHGLVAWFLTFQFVNVTWIFFRAASWQDAWKVLQGMLGLNGLEANVSSSLLQDAGMIGAFLLIVWLGKNSIQAMASFRPKWSYAAWAAAMFVVSLLFFNRISEFLYFNF